jgi:hypothetical protein
MNATVNNLKNKINRLNKSPKFTAIQVAVLTGLLFYISWQMLSLRLFLINDTGLRFIQIQEIIANDWQTLAISYPQRIYDTELQHLPYTGAAIVIGEQIFIAISPFFNIATAYFYHTLGSAGLSVVPTLGAVVTAVALFQLGRLTGLPYARVLLWATVFATPILIYSVKLWDHTLSTALSTWAIYFIVRGLQKQPRSTLFLLGGGVCLGLGLGQRPEMYPFTLAVAGSLLLTTKLALKPTALVAAGGLLGALPVWIAQWLWVGHPMGMSVGAIFFGYGRASSEPISAASVTTVTTAVTQLSLDLFKAGRFLFDVPDHLTLAASLGLAVGAVIIVLAIRAQPRRMNLALLLGFVILLLSYSIWFHYGSQRFVVGIFPTFPLFVFALAYPGYHGRWAYNQQTYKFVAVTAILFLTLILTLWPAYGGYQWGSRYLLAIYPLLIYMGWFTFASYEKFLGESNKKAQAVWRIMAFGLLVASTLLQFTGVRTLHSIYQELDQIRTIVADLPTDIILTNHYYLASHVASLPEKQIFYVTGEEDIKKLVRRFAAGQIDQIAIIPGTIHVPRHSRLKVPEVVDQITLEEIEPLLYKLHQP